MQFQTVHSFEERDPYKAKQAYCIKGNHQHVLMYVFYLFIRNQNI